MQRLAERAVAQATADVSTLRDAFTAEVGKEIGSIFDFHLGVLKDKAALKQITNDIKANQTTAEYSVSIAMRRYANTVAAIKDKYLSERVKDIHDVEKRLLKLLIGQKHEDLTHLTHDVVVIAHDLLPSQTAALDREHVKGFAIDVGGRTSHTAIVARAIGIPAVVGLGNITAEVSGGDIIIIDGTRGVVIVNPDDEQLADYRETGRKYKEGERERQALWSQPARTLDGHEVSLQANIEFPEDIEDADTRGAQGIGLYRTEFLYLAKEREPTEQEHYEAYAEALRRLKGKPLVIRTLDLGADKYTVGQSHNLERNPFLGDRSIRMCLHDIPMFKRQLRAIMRASVMGDVRIMFPMICTVMELRQARMVLEDVKEELDEENVPFRREIPIGMMVEVPSVAIMPDQFAKEVNFFSIGTNDLIQYTLAVDRTNERVAGLYCPAHPSVLKLIRDVIRAGRRNSISVSVCGEMAGDPLYTLLCCWGWS